MKKITNAELGRKSKEEFLSAVKTPIIIVLDNVRSLHNVGSVFRTADAFLCEAIYLCGITASPPHREIEKTALGATETVLWKYFKTTSEAIVELISSGYQIIAIEQAEGSVSLENFSPDKNKKQAVIFGHEMTGVSDQVLEHSDAAIEVTQYGTKHSLNISVCAGIVIYGLFQKLKKGNL